MRRSRNMRMSRLVRAPVAGEPRYGRVEPGPERSDPELGSVWTTNEIANETIENSWICSQVGSPNAINEGTKGHSPDRRKECGRALWVDPA